MTTDKQAALDALDALKSSHIGIDNKIGQSAIETIRQALTAPAVDVESLKEPPTAIRLTDYSKGYGDGWNKCIDYLTARGLIGNAPNILAMVKAYEEERSKYVGARKKAWETRRQKYGMKGHR